MHPGAPAMNNLEMLERQANLRNLMVIVKQQLEAWRTTWTPESIALAKQKLDKLDKELMWDMLKDR